MTKRLIALLLAAVLIFSLFPAYALATEEDAEYKIGDTLEVEGTAAPTAKIPENTKWEQQGEAQQRPAEEPGCGKTPHAHGDGSSCDLHCTLEAHTHVINCPADCSLHVHNQDCCKATHIHGTGCNCQTEEHSHNDSCYGNCPTHTCTEECQIPEGGTCPSIHTHSESCVPACGKEPHTHSDDCCTAVHEHSDQCIPGCGQENHTHITDGCGGEGTCTIPEHSHGDGSTCQMECALEEHAHTDNCYEMITYTTWKVVEKAPLLNTANMDCGITEGHLFACVVDPETGNNGEHIHELTLPVGQSRNLRFFFGTNPENANAPSMDNLLCSGDMLFAPGNGCLVVGPTSASTQYITSGSSRFAVTGILPDYGFFSRATRDSQYAVADYNNAAGVEITLYLLWAADSTAPDTITATVDGNELELTVTENDDHLVVTFDAPASGDITFRLQADSSDLGTITLEDARITVGEDEEHLITLDYEGTPITVGFGISPDYIRLNTDGGSRFSYEASYPYDQYYTFYLGALKDFGTHEELPAPQSFYDAVKNVSLTIENFTNLSGNSETCNGSFQEDDSTDVTVDNIHTRGNTLYLPKAKLFEATLKMSFEYPAGTTHTLRLFFCFDSSDILLDAYDLDTAEELNGILSSDTALLTWFEATNKTAYDRFMATRDGFIDIFLPKVTYDAPIESLIVPSQESRIYYNCIRLHGHEEGTTMPGLQSKGGIFALFGLDFVAPRSNSETCGILTEGGIASNTLSAVIGCSFDGYEYGIRSTATGHVAQVSNSTFTDCENAIYVDCTQNPTVRSDTMYYYRNTFHDAKFAITIRNHPNGSTPYAAYAAENSFINCKKDFKVTTPGNPHYYHFTKNYYGNSSNARSATGYTTRSAIVDITGAGNSIPVVVTNPCLVNYNDYNTLGIDDSAGLHSMIINSEAASTKVNGSELAKIQNKTEVHIINNGQAAATGSNIVATWIFGGESE